MLPWPLSGIVNGLNGTKRPPKRSWGRGKMSSSLNRNLQHRLMWRFVDDERFAQLRGRARCLDWDGWYGASIFASICREVDVISYAKPFGPVRPRMLAWSATKGRKADRWFHADAHSMSRVLPRAAYDLLILNSVFEHLRQPFDAMRECVRLLRPGGLLFLHTPAIYPMHGVPDDFVRYTLAGVRALVEGAGLQVVSAEEDGGAAAVLGNILAVHSQYWSAADLAVSGAASPSLYMNTLLVACQPPGCPAQEPASRPRLGDPLDGDGFTDGSTCWPQLLVPPAAGFADSLRSATRRGLLPLPGPPKGRSAWDRLQLIAAARFGADHGAALLSKRAHCLAADEGSGGDSLWERPLLAQLRRCCCASVQAEPWRGDHSAAASADLLVSGSTFGRLPQPFVAMAAAAVALKPGGLLFYHAPFEMPFEQGERFRFTTSGARFLAESQGLQVLSAVSDGGYGAVLASTLGLGTDAWSEAELQRAGRGGHYLATLMVARRPR